MKPAISVDQKNIAAFCRKWKIVEFSLFGSVLRSDFRPESDIDVLVSFAPDDNWNLFDWVDMIDELKNIFGRDVDLVEKDSIRNPFRRRSILDNHEVLYAA